VEAIVDIPAVRMVVSSERVILARCGLTTRDDSTPTKISLETQSDSAPLTLISLVNTRAKSRMKKGMIPR
jgi:hypothetical protein